MSQKPFTLLSLPTIPITKNIVKEFPFPIKYTKGSFKNIVFTFHNSNIQILHEKTDLKDFSFIWLSSSWNTRDIAYAIRLYLDLTKTSSSYVEKSTSKLTDYMTFAIQKVPMPDTFFMQRKDIKNNLKHLEEVCGYPIIIKDTKGARGKHLKCVSTENELLEEMKTLPKSKDFIFQRYIPNEYDWGIMVVNGVVVSGEKSYPADGEFRNNGCNGATEKFMDVQNIPENIKQIALKASKSLGLSWSRADIIIDKNTGLPYLLEVNRYPGITAGSTEVSGAYTFLASHIMPNPA